MQGQDHKVQHSANRAGLSVAANRKPFHLLGNQPNHLVTSGIQQQTLCQIGWKARNKVGITPRRWQFSRLRDTVCLSTDIAMQPFCRICKTTLSVSVLGHTCKLCTLNKHWWTVTCFLIPALTKSSVWSNSELWLAGDSHTRGCPPSHKAPESHLRQGLIVACSWKPPT